MILFCDEEFTHDIVLLIGLTAECKQLSFWYALTAVQNGNIPMISVTTYKTTQSHIGEEEYCSNFECLKIFKIYISFYRPPLWSSGQSSWIEMQGSRVRFPGTTKKSSGSGTGSTQPCEYNWGTVIKKENVRSIHFYVWKIHRTHSLQDNQHIIYEPVHIEHK
jgi:hypothetical protein